MFFTPTLNPRALIKTPILYTMNVKRTIYLLLESLVNTFFPRFCCVCNKKLVHDEQFICLHCLLHLPYTHFKGKKGNPIERIICDDRICVEHANSLFYYKQKSSYSRIFFHFKYYNHPQVAIYFGRLMAQDLALTDFFTTIDCIIPIPLSKQRQKSRGYNQSEKIAEGISQITHIPVDTTSVIREVDNPSQTRMTGEDRWLNVNRIFHLAHPESVAHKHVLIVDDMITTGSTIRACAHTLTQVDGVKISVISLGTSQRNRRYVYLG